MVDVWQEGDMDYSFIFLKPYLVMLSTHLSSLWPFVTEKTLVLSMYVFRVVFGM